MTQVRIDLRQEWSNAAQIPLRRGMTWAPSAAHVDPVEGDDVALVLPESFPVVLNYAPVTIEVEPSNLPHWVWRVAYESDSQQVVEYVEVPDIDGIVQFTDLVRIDPATLSPAVEPEAAWWAAVENISGPTDEQVAEAVEDYLDAHPVETESAVRWLSLVPGDTAPLRIWKPSVEEPQAEDGALDGDLWLKKQVT